VTRTKSEKSLGVALRAGLLRAPLSLDPATAGLLRTLHIPNAARKAATLPLNICHARNVRRS